jgi:hypothetical protein
MQILLTMMQDKDTQFYKGLSAYYLLCSKPVLQYTVFEQVKAAWLQFKNAKSGSNGSHRQQQSSLTVGGRSFLVGQGCSDDCDSGGHSLFASQGGHANEKDNDVDSDCSRCRCRWYYQGQQQQQQ